MPWKSGGKASTENAGQVYLCAVGQERAADVLSASCDNKVSHHAYALAQATHGRQTGNPQSLKSLSQRMKCKACQDRIDVAAATACVRGQSGSMISCSAKGGIFRAYLEMSMHLTGKSSGYLCCKESAACQKCEQ